jgi:hypothetical protein
MNDNYLKETAYLEDAMEILVGLGFIGLVAFFGIRKFKNASKKDCCR